MSAMMLPLAVTTIRRVAHSNFRYRTDRSIAMFLTGYLAVWLVASVVVVVTVMAMVSVAGFPAASAAAVVLAVIWQRTALKRRALRRCDAPVALAAHGWRADQEHIGLGFAIGWRCVLNCWAAMSTVAALGHDPLIMAAALVWLMRERYGRWVFQHARAAITSELRWASADARSLGAAAR